MLAAWRSVFAGASRAEIGTDHGDERTPVTTLDKATLDTLLPEIGLSPRALNAVERANLRTVRDLIHYPLAQIRRLRGVGSKTRRELAECLERLAERFPDAAAEPKKLPVEEVEATAGPAEAPSIDVLADLLVPAGRTEESQASARAVESLLGLITEAADESGGALAASSWPSQSEVARGLAVDPGTVEPCPGQRPEALAEDTGDDRAARGHRRPVGKPGRGDDRDGAGGGPAVQPWVFAERAGAHPTRRWPSCVPR